MEDDALDLQDISEDAVLGEDNDDINYMNVDISTDNIEDIVTSKMGDKLSHEDIYMMHSSEEADPNDLEIPKTSQLMIR